MSRTYSIDHDDGEQEAWLPSQLRIPTLLLGVWLLVYSVPAMLGGTPIVIEGVRQYATEVPADFAPWVAFALYAAWLTVGVGPAIVGTLLVAYQFLGWERVRVTPKHLVVKREVFGLAIRRKFPHSALFEARLAPPLRLKRWFVGSGTIVLGSGERTYRFGAGLNPAEAAEVLRALTADAEPHRPEVTEDAG